jgi:tetratricopeptide (TPR) repeat protein
VVLFSIAQAHRKLGHLDQAIEAYERFLTTKPKPGLKAETEGYLTELRRVRTARVSVAEAEKLFAAGDHLGAGAIYAKAYDADPRPVLLYRMGLCHHRAGHKAKAIEAYEKFLKAETDPELLAEAKKALDELRAEPEPAGSTGPPLKIGGKAGPEGGATPAGVPGPDEAPSPRRSPMVPVAVTLSALGAAGVAAGIAFGALAMGKARDLEAAACTEPGAPDCPVYEDEGESIFDTGRRMNTAAIVGFAAGGAILAAGAALLIASATGKSAESTEVTVGPGGLGLAVSF